MVDWLIVVREAALEISRKAGSFLAGVFWVLVILFIGWIVAKFLEQLIVKVLKLMRLDVVSEKAGVAAFFAKGGIKLALSELVGVLVYWIVMLIVFVTIANAVGLTIAAQLLDNAVMYIPNVVAGLFILVLGIYSATLVGAVVRTAAANAGLAMANGLGRLSQIVIIVFAVVAALEQLQIAPQVLQTLLTVVLGSFGLGLAIAIGLGCKDIAAKYVNDFLQQLQKRS